MAQRKCAHRRVASNECILVLRQVQLISYSGLGTGQMYVYIAEAFVMQLYRIGKKFVIIITSEVRTTCCSSEVKQLPYKDFLTNVLGLHMCVFGQHPKCSKHNRANHSIERDQICGHVSGGLLFYVFPHYDNPLNESESPNEEIEQHSNEGTEIQTSQDENKEDASKFPVQVSDDRENETTKPVYNHQIRTMQTETGDEHSHNLKWKRAKYPDFDEINNRLETYSEWPLEEPSPSTLCQAGFFFTGHSYDLVRCFCCGIGLKDFSDTDNPLLEHVKHSANCPFLLDLFGSREALEQYKQRFVSQDPEEIRQRQRALFERQQGNEHKVTYYRAKHEQFRTLCSRLDTFKHWRFHSTQTPEQLADAGMYYTGVDDHCRCFACDGGFRKWEPGDDPWIEHCRWFPACPYAREVMGDELINLIQLSADQALKGNTSRYQDDVNVVMDASTTEYFNVQRIVNQNRELLILDMGFPIDDVKVAVQELVQQATYDPDVDDIITRLEVMNERRILANPTLKAQEQPYPGGTPSAEALLEPDQRLKSMFLCHICHNNQVNALFLPCTHHKYCLDCVQQIDRCPDCGRAIQDIIRTFMI
ncbi:baculoviral IAP repeat-containing protein 7-like [Dreissena polymorpha]|uniref:baculoviral IAP repeat-containing protein 7-like n=1 Tax=Dreissena polymorpha TaxID=45954 RepID=UPI00226456F9|nr:baculoviral IAP repeat-containing protein 7-like [Dreissena polymorpha]XP_052238127.1 baculoviral IAP repeat-containing protein 7-like [Dreissena polymorpha]